MASNKLLKVVSIGSCFLQSDVKLIDSCKPTQTC
jgi:hypothetical protein